jgi:DNA-directed RNA polymerase specialized sigma24 family protein
VASRRPVPTVRRCSADPREIQRIWREHRRWVAAILLAHKPRETDLDDLLQVVAVAVVRKIGELRDPEALKPWLRTVAINAARASGRETQRSRKKLRLVREKALADGGSSFAAGRTSDRPRTARRADAFCGSRGRSPRGTASRC